MREMHGRMFEMCSNISDELQLGENACEYFYVFYKMLVMRLGPDAENGAGGLEDTDDCHRTIEIFWAMVYALYESHTSEVSNTTITDKDSDLNCCSGCSRR